jgi:hypothetical protein
MDRPIPDPVVLLASWMEWEKGDALPGKLIADLKKAGLRDLLEELVRLKAEVGGGSE